MHWIINSKNFAISDWCVVPRVSNSVSVFENSVLVIFEEKFEFFGFFGFYNFLRENALKPQNFEKNEANFWNRNVPQMKLPWLYPANDYLCTYQFITEK